MMLQVSGPGLSGLTPPSSSRHSRNSPETSESTPSLSPGASVEVTVLVPTRRMLIPVDTPEMPRTPPRRAATATHGVALDCQWALPVGCSSCQPEISTGRPLSMSSDTPRPEKVPNFPSPRQLIIHDAAGPTRSHRDGHSDSDGKSAQLRRSGRIPENRPTVTAGDHAE
jgi:hypothetical protein